MKLWRNLCWKVRFLVPDLISVSRWSIFQKADGSDLIFYCFILKNWDLQMNLWDKPNYSTVYEIQRISVLKNTFMTKVNFFSIIHRRFCSSLGKIINVEKIYIFFWKQQNKNKTVQSEAVIKELLPLFVQRLLCHGLILQSASATAQSWQLSHIIRDRQREILRLHDGKLTRCLQNAVTVLLQLDSVYLSAFTGDLSLELQLFVPSWRTVARHVTRAGHMLWLLEDFKLGFCETVLC